MIQPIQTVKLNPSDWNEKDIESKIYDVLSYSKHAKALTFNEGRAIARHAAQIIIMRFNECIRLAEKES